MFSSSAQDLTESNVEKADCDMRQGDKISANDVGELTSNKEKEKSLIIPVVCILQFFHWNHVDLILLLLVNN